MKKKWLTLLLSGLMVLSLAGCGGGAPVENTAPEVQESAPATPPDLSGEWKQANSNAGDSYQAAYIADGAMEVYWILNEGSEEETFALYWAGTFTPPTSADEPYVWESVNDKERTGSALFASDTDTKAFTYQDGGISYSVTFQGETFDVELAKQEWGYGTKGSDNFLTDAILNGGGDSAQNTTGKSEALPHEVKEFAYAMNGEYLYYAVVIHNPNMDYALDYPTFRVTARDAEGILLGTEDQTLSIIYPGQDFSYAFQAFHVDEVPSTVDIEIIPPESHNIRVPETLKRPEYTPMTVVNTAMRGSGMESRIVGEVRNDNDYTYDNAIVTVFFRDAEGKLIAGESTFIDNVSAHSTTPFEININQSFATENYEVYANIW